LSPFFWKIMLQTIHDKLKGIFAITILVALGIVFVFWGVDVSVGSFTKARGIEVNGKEIPVEEVLQNYQDELSRFQAAFGAAGVPEDMRTALQTRVLEQAVRSELIRQRTRELHYEAGPEQVLAAIRQIPAFQAGGQFSADAYHAALRSINMSPAQFEAEQRDVVLARQIDRGITTSAFVLPSEFERQAALRNETRELAWVIVPAAGFTASVEIDDAAVAAYYEANKERYMTEELATVDFVELDIERFAAAADVSEAELREYYETNKARYTTPGRRHARHILIAIGDDEAAAEARARAAYERARAGEDFAALARELSDDAGSKESGGDLGFAQRDDFVAAFGAAVWSMTPGEIRGPVRTEFGWHIIRLEAVDPEVTRTFDEVRAELEPELRRAKVEKAFGDAQEQLDTIAFEAAGNLASVAEQMKLPVRRIERYTRAGSAEFGASPQLTDDVFAPDVIAGREVRTVELEPGKVVAIAVVAHSPSRPRTLEEIRPEIVEAARLEKAQQLAATKAGALTDELTAGAAWATATRAWQQPAAAPTHAPRQARRDDAQVPGEIRSAAFKAPAPQDKPRYGIATLGTGDTAVWTVTSVRSGSLAALSQDDRQRELDQARERAALADATAYIAAMRANADVDINPKLFE
jgi:peptidyl-prolyl cis-trans isomerase D